MLSCSVVSDSVTSWAIVHKSPLSVIFSKQEYWSGLPFKQQQICIHKIYIIHEVKYYPGVKMNKSYIHIKYG